MNYVDLHCHLLWGVDDGARTEGDALEMARALHAVGFRRIACSPHARPEFPSDDPALCERRRAELQAALAREGIELALEPNAENVLDPELVARVARQPRSIGRGPFLLAEAPHLAPLPQLPEIVFQLRVKGVRPLLAHPERCREFEKPGRAEEAVRAGALLQLDVGALIGRYGRNAERLARAFLEQRLYAVAATDLHSPRDAEKWVGASIEALRAIAGEAEATRLLRDAPAAILRGEEPPPPAPPERRPRGPLATLGAWLRRPFS